MAGFARALERYDAMPEQIDPMNPKCPALAAWRWVERAALVAASNTFFVLNEAGIIDDHGRITEKGKRVLQAGEGSDR